MCLGRGLINAYSVYSLGTVTNLLVMYMSESFSGLILNSGF